MRFKHFSIIVTIFTLILTIPHGKTISALADTSAQPDRQLPNATITRPETISGSLYGQSLKFDSSTNTLAVGAPGHNNGRGVIFIFHAPGTKPPPLGG